MDTVVAQGQKELAAHGEQPLVSLIIGRAYADKQQFREAVPYLTKSLNDARTPTDEKAWSKAYLGTCYYGLQQYPEARQALEAVVAEAATKNVTSYAKNRLGIARAAEVASKWEALETSHFRFRFQNPKRVGSIQSYAALHEQAYETNNRFFQATLPRKIDFFVWDDGLEAKKILGQELGFTQPYMVTIHVLPDQTKGHEITHMLTHYGMQPPRKNHFINEGVAVCFDQTNRNRMQVARQATSGQTIDIWQMWEHPETYSNKELYPVGGALLEYLLAHSSEAEVKRLLREQTPQLGRQLFSQQVADFEKELNKPGAASSPVNIPVPPAFPAPVKVDAALVNAKVERTNTADKFYKVLILLNGIPITATQMQQINPQQIKNIKVLHTKQEMQPYTDVELNAVILLLTAS